MERDQREGFLDVRAVPGERAGSVHYVTSDGHVFVKDKTR